MAGIEAFLAGIQANPLAFSEYTAAYQAESALFAAYSAAGDTIASGTATGSQILADLATYITDEQTLLTTLQSYAATVPGASAWAGAAISQLQSTINAELELLYNNGGTISNLPIGSELLGSAQPSDATTISAMAATANTQYGPNIGQAGIVNYASGSDIKEVGYGNEGAGQSLDVMGAFNTLMGSYLLAIGSFNLENGTFDVVVGSSNTISGSYDTAFGNNDTIVGNSAQIYGTSLTASAGQTVFGTASNYTVINSDGTWSTVVNGSATVGTGVASSVASLMASESAAMASAYATAQTNDASLSAQFVALGYSQMVSSISADMVAGNFSRWNFAGSATGSVGATDIATESLALQEAAAGSYTAAAATLSILAMSSNAVVASIASAEISLDTHADWTLDWTGISAAASYIYGNSAAAMSTFVAELSSATGLTVSFSPVTGISYSSATPVGSLAPSDMATESLALQEAAAGSYAAAAATLSILAASSNAAVASIASGELLIITTGQWNNDIAGISAAAGYIYGNSTAAMSTFYTDVNTAHDIATENLAMQEAAAGSYAAAAATLSLLAMSSNPAVASIASAELIILEGAKWNADIAGMSIAASFIDGNATAAMSTVAAELGSVVGSTMVWTGTAFAVSSAAAPPPPPPPPISASDQAQLQILAPNDWKATSSVVYNGDWHLASLNSAQYVSALLQIVSNDGTNTIVGADAAAALELFSMGADPTQAVAQLESDQAIPGMTSSTETISNLSAQDRANIVIADSLVNQKKWAALGSIIPRLETSTNSLIANLANGEQLIYGDKQNSALAIEIMYDYLQGITPSVGLLESYSQALKVASGSNNNQNSSYNITY